MDSETTSNRTANRDGADSDVADDVADIAARVNAGGSALYLERLDQFGEFLLLLDRNLKVIHMTSEATNQFGYSLEVFRKSDLLSFLHPDDVEEASAGLGRVLSGQNRYQRPDFRIRTMQGDWREVEILATNQLNNPAVRAIVLLVNDISERKSSEREYESSAALFATVFRVSNDICAITVPETGEFVDVNRKWLETFGYQREEVIGNTSIALNIWGSDTRRVELLEAFAEAGSLQEFEAQVRTKNGDFRHLLLSVEELDVVGGKRLYFSARDITEEKRIAEQLQHAQKMEAVGQLTGGIAHDFNNLLGVILGNAELLQTELPADAETSAYLQEILKATERGSSLTRRLLAFSRKQALQPKEFFPHAHLGRMLEILRHSLGEKIDVQILTGKNLWPCYADPGQFESVILNIALNARDAMPEGGSLTLSVRNVTMDGTVPEVDPGDYVRVAVKDSGTGMATDVLARVFEPFFTTKEVGKGSGLGLSMVFGFIKQSGGYVAIESEPGRGTLVKFMLPRYQARAEAD